jgi:hypothetical protein
MTLSSLRGAYYSHHNTSIIGYIIVNYFVKDYSLNGESGGYGGSNSWDKPPDIIGAGFG